jgi:hypothetical protein
MAPRMPIMETPSSSDDDSSVEVSKQHTLGKKRDRFASGDSLVQKVKYDEWMGGDDVSEQHEAVDDKHKKRFRREATSSDSSSSSSNSSEQEDYSKVF